MNENKVKSGFDGSSAALHRANQERSRLKAFAYRLLGSTVDAEDAIQETYLRWYRMGQEARKAIIYPLAWQKTTLSRICLDKLKSAKHKREVYIGEWLPDPIPEGTKWDAINDTQHPTDLSDGLVLANSVSMALLIVLDRMTPAERVSFILHDVFQYSFDEISDIVGRSTQACRQLAFSARKRVASKQHTRPSRQEHERLNEAFHAAWMTGDIHSLISVLDQNAHAITDGGGVVTASVNPLHGPGEIIDFFISAFERQPNLRISATLVNGDPGFVGKVGKETVAVISTDIVNHRISDIWVVRNPNKLNAWH